MVSTPTGTAPEGGAATAPDADALRRSCTRFLNYHYPRSPRQALEQLAARTDPDSEGDRYGEGELIAGFERAVAELLGKEAALFMPSGTMCQQIALRILTDRRGIPHVAMHPRNHLDRHEHHAYQRLHGLRGIPAGDPDRLLSLDDLRGVAEPLGAVLIELPQRELGGQLPGWEELGAVAGWAEERGVPLHLDGARLWESGPFYGRPYAEIARPFTTVYVSFYKGLGGIAGAILAGPGEIIAEARIWQRRHGGNLVQLYPYLLSAQGALADRLGRMAAYHDKAVEIAAALAGSPEIAIVPDPPHTNMMRVYLRADREWVQAAALDLAREEGVWLFTRLAPAPIPAYCWFELTVGDATLDLSTPEIVDLFSRLLEQAAS